MHAQQISAGDPEASLFGGARVMHGHVCGFWSLEPFFRRRSAILLQLIAVF
jgi:hypothetical protein